MLNPATIMGSIISREQHTHILDYIKSGSAEGARLLCGGGPPRNPGLAAGCFIEPTVFAGVTSQMKIAREEIFDPVLSVLCWQDEQQMIREVNDSPYGLTCAI
ncbi:MAG: aldehyde dehydrogenase family protein [Steroidobacteraceae bacterium]